jgi:hypothetical protein
LCDELLKAIKTRDDLLALHNDRLTESMCADDDLHILVYDIMYCAKCYNLYNNIQINKPKKVKAKTEKENEKRQREEQKMELLVRIDEWYEAGEKLARERAEYENFSAVGVSVSNKKLGVGMVVAQDDRYITVSFGGEKKVLQAPTCFTTGFLLTENVQLVENFVKLSNFDMEIEKCAKEVRYLSNALKKLDV